MSLDTTRRTRLRTAHGSNMVELGAIITIMSVIVLFCINAAVVFMAGSINDRACRDAARAAAQASTSTSAQQQAQAALKSYTSSNTFVGNPTFSSTDFVYQDYGGNPPPDTSPFVSVTTTLNAKIPAPAFWGMSFGQSGSINMKQTYQFPIVKTQLYLN